MFRPTALIVVLLACLFAAPAGAQVNYDTDPTYQAARADAEAGRNAEAFPVFKRVAEDGFAKAQYNLAIFYRDGRGTLPSQGLYRKWMEASAAQEFHLALFTLGLDYDVGRGVAKDLPRALGYYERAAEAGNAMAAYNAGQINLMGEGAVPANHVKAVRFLEVAAKAKDQKSLMTLGYVYETGMTGRQDIDLSRDYYYRAESTGHPGAAEAIDRLKEVASRAAFDKLLANDHAGAFAAFRQLCNEEDMEACAYYGNYLANGAPGVPGSFPDALPPLKRSCDAGDIYGCKFLAYAIVRGKRFGDEDTRYKAASWFANRCGATPGDQEACYNLAVMYYNGTVKGGKDKARPIAAEACAAKYANACRMVTEIDAQRAYSARQRAEADRKAEEFAAQSQRSYSASVPASYRSASSGSSSSYASSSAAQDSRDFDAFINKVNSYGTGYSASCRTGNPYC